MTQQKKPSSKLTEFYDIVVVKKLDKPTIIPWWKRGIIMISKGVLAILLGMSWAISLPALSDATEDALETPLVIQKLINEVNVVPEPTPSQRASVWISSAWAGTKRQYRAVSDGIFNPSEREKRLEIDIIALKADVEFLTGFSADLQGQIQTRTLERGVRHKKMASCSQELSTYLEEIGAK